MPRKILFIVNPNAGKRISDAIVDMIRAEFPANIYFQVAVWKDKDHFEEIISILKEGDYTDAVAIGGDGTVNRVAATLLGTNIALGIVPIGSGNGLARSLGLSMNIHKVITQIAEGKTAMIDTGTVNGTPFFCTSGVGFDAHIGNCFASSLKRGLQSYVKITVREIFRYRAKEYTLELGGKVIKKKAFLITVANAGQYGNDFYIAPQADMQDGLFHIVLLKPFNVFKTAGLLQKILGRRAFLAQSIETYTADKLVIERTEKDFIHFDGEPASESARLAYVNHPRSLKVIVGEGFKAS